MTGVLKIKKRSFPILLLGLVALVIIIVANVIVWRSYNDKQAQVETIKIQVAQVNQQVADTPQPPSGLESQLATAKDELAAALLYFPGNIDRNDVFDFIINTADECKVAIVPLVADGTWTDASGQSANVLRYHGTVSGNLSQTSEFMTRLQNGRFPTMIITECSVKRVIIEGEPFSRDEMEVTVNFEIALYVSSVKGHEDTAS